MAKEDNPLFLLLTTYESDHWCEGIAGNTALTNLTWTISPSYDHSIIKSIAGENSTDDNITITPADNFYGTTTITLVLWDKEGKNATQDVILTWIAVNENPTINGTIGYRSANEDNTIIIDFNDIAGIELDVTNESTDNGLVWYVVSYNSSAIKLISGQNSTSDALIFTPQDDWYGLTYVTIALKDEGDLTNTQIIALGWNSTNDAPIISPRVPSPYSIVEEGVSWSKLSPSGTLPIARFDHTAVLNTTNDKMIVFGGAYFNGVGTKISLNDVWVLSNASGVDGTPIWSQLTPAGSSPSARYHHSAVYDSANDILIIFGGTDNTQFFGDVWTLSNATGLTGTPTWTQLSPSGTPLQAREGHTVVYDESNNRMTIFGGANNGVSLNDVWVLSNANGKGGTPTWAQLSPTGTPPSGRYEHTSVYNPVQNRMIVFGGSGTPTVNDVWVLSNANGIGGTPVWTQLSPLGTPPSARFFHSAIYDYTNDKMTIFGGNNGINALNDLWILSSASDVSGTGTSTWAQISVATTKPTGREDQVAVYNPQLNIMTIFSGGDGTSYFNDTWVLYGGNGITNGFKAKENNPLFLMLTTYESDHWGESVNANLTWTVASYNTSLIKSISGQNSSDDNITITPADNYHGTTPITLRLWDANGAYVDQVTYITWISVNENPTIASTIPSQAANEDTNISVNLKSYESDATNESTDNGLVWYVVSYNSSAIKSISGQNYTSDTLIFTPQDDWYGITYVTIALKDEGDLTATQIIRLGWNSVNDNPIISSDIPSLFYVNSTDTSGFKAKENNPLFLVLTTYESDHWGESVNANLTWTVASYNTSLIKSISGQNSSDDNITITPADNYHGTTPITLRLWDANGAYVDQVTYITWISVNENPTIASTIPSQAANEDTNISVNLKSYESDATNESTDNGLVWYVVSYNSSAIKSISGQNYTSDTLIFTPQDDWYGITYVTIALKDEGDLTATQVVRLAWSSVNDPPFISPSVPNPYIIKEGTVGIKVTDGHNLSIALTPYENDHWGESNHSNLTWTVVRYDTLIISSISGENSTDDTITLTPRGEWGGNTNITLRLRDGDGAYIDVEVNLTFNDAPMINGTVPDAASEEDNPIVLDLNNYEYNVQTETEDNDLRWYVSAWNSTAIKYIVGQNGTNDTLVFYPQENWYGRTTVTITLRKVSSGLTAWQDVQLTWTPVKDTPVISPGIPSPYTIQSGRSGSLVNENNNITVYLTTYECDRWGESVNANLTWTVSLYDTSVIKYVLGQNSTDDKITFVPANDYWGTTNVTLRLWDADGNYTEQNVSLFWLPVNEPPWISPTIPDQSASEDLNISVNLTAYEHDHTNESIGVGLNWYVASYTPSVISVILGQNSSNDTLTFVPVTDWYGTTQITLVLVDGGGLTAEQAINLTWYPVNDLPFISPRISDPLPVDENNPINLSLKAYEHDHWGESVDANLTWAVSSYNTSLIKYIIGENSAEDNITIAPADNYHGAAHITLRLWDGDGAYVEQEINLTWLSVNEPPTILGEIGDRVALEDVPISINLTTFESDIANESTGDGLLWYISYWNGSAINYVTGQNNTNDTLTFYPQKDWYGITNVTIVLTDDDGGKGGVKTDSQVINLTWLPVNDVPIITPKISNKIADEDISITINLTGYETDAWAESVNANLTWMVSYYNKSAIANITGQNSSNDTITFIPVKYWHGTTNVTLRLQDGEGLYAEQEVNLTWRSIDTPPWIEPRVPDQYANEDNNITLYLKPYEHDAYGESVDANLTWSIQNLTENVTIGKIDNTTDTITLVTYPDWYGVINATLVLRDGSGRTVVQAINLTWYSVNDAPRISKIPDLNLTAHVTKWIELMPYIWEDNKTSQIIISTNSGYATVYNTNHSMQIEYSKGISKDTIFFTVSDGQYTTNSTISVTVKDYLEFKSTEEGNITLEFGKSTTYSIMLVNNGDYTTFKVSAQSSNSKLTIGIDNTTVSLDTGESKKVTFTISAAKDLPPGEYNITITGSTEDGKISYSKGLSATVTEGEKEGNMLLYIIVIAVIGAVGGIVGVMLVRRRMYAGPKEEPPAPSAEETQKVGELQPLPQTEAPLQEQPPAEAPPSDQPSETPAQPQEPPKEEPPAPPAEPQPPQQPPAEEPKSKIPPKIPPRIPPKLPPRGPPLPRKKE
ncbi:MAG: kelch repeat-containing protein [Thermoplasmata archaeon]